MPETENQETQDDQETESIADRPFKGELEETETGKETEEEPAASKTLVFFSPEGLMMMGIATFLDVLGFIGLGEIFIPDILGLIVVGGWLWFRSGTAQVTSGTKKRAGKLLGRMGRTGRFLLRAGFVIGEFIPLVGIAPLWMILVALELMSDQ